MSGSGSGLVGGWVVWSVSQSLAIDRAQNKRHKDLYKFKTTLGEKNTAAFITKVNKA